MSTRRQRAGGVDVRRGRESVDAAHLLPRREDAIAKALQKKLEQRRAMREAGVEGNREAMFNGAVSRFFLFLLSSLSLCLRLSLRIDSYLLISVSCE